MSLFHKLIALVLVIACLFTGVLAQKKGQAPKKAVPPKKTEAKGKGKGKKSADDDDDEEDDEDDESKKGKGKGKGKKAEPKKTASKKK